MPISTAATRHQATRFPKTLAATPHDSDLCPTRKPHLRRRIRNPAFPGSASGGRLRRSGVSPGGRRSGPTTPLLRWKFNDKPPPEFGQKVGEIGAGGLVPPRVSARKLAAGIWHLRPLDISAVGGRGAGDALRAQSGLEQHVLEHLGVKLLYNPLSADLHSLKTKKNDYASPVSVLSPKNGDFHKIKHFGGFPSSVMERATKWDPESSMTSEEVYRFYSHLKLLEDQEVNTVSVVSSLKAELQQARARISVLETERQTAKKKLEQFLKRLAEEKASWRSREHEKVRVVIDGLKDSLKTERKKRQRLEIVNSKLVDELAEVKLIAKRLLQDYEKERKARELVEEVCDELAKEIAEDKGDIEALKMEAMRIREEVEEEKKMLQMAEVWREERVQMKLIDAKLTLEDKYSQLSKLKAELEAFLDARKNVDIDAKLVKEAELLKEQADLVKVEDIKEFYYKPPPPSEDINAVFEELQPREETHERDIKPSCGCTPTIHASKVNMASPASDLFLEHLAKQCANGFIDSTDDADDDSGWETVSHDEEQGSSNSRDGSEPSVNGYCKESNGSVSGADWEEKGGSKFNNEIIKVSSMNAKLSRKRVSSICRLWRSSTQDTGDDLKRTSLEVRNEKLLNGRISNATMASTNGENYNKDSVEIANGRLSNGRISNGTSSPDVGLGETGFSPESTRQWSSPDSLNPHTTRGIKGCIEWPRNSQKHSLKAKLMEARMESQKVQLRHVLKQKF